MRVVVYRNLEELPRPCRDFLAVAYGGSVFTTVHWLESRVQDATVEDHRLELFVVEGEPERPPLAVLIGYESLRLKGHRGSRALFFGQLDGMSSALRFGPEARDQGAILRAVVESVAARRPRVDVLKFSGLDPEAPLYAALSAILRAAGFVVQHYHQFPGYHEVTAGLSSEEYLRSRPSELRNTLRRKGKKLWAMDGARFELITGGERLGRGIEAYNRVFSASWKKDDDPLPERLIGASIRCAADVGALRLGVIYLDDAPAAAQFWIVSADRAACHRLAYDEKYKRLSVGSILTQKMIEHLLDTDHVAELDFGIGDEVYKKDWMSVPRDWAGIAAFNRRSGLGLLGMARHFGVQPLRRILRPLRPGLALMRRLTR